MLHTIRSLAIATGLAQVNGDVADLLDKVLAQHRPALDAILRKFFLAEVTPENTFNFERELAEELRKIGAQTVEDAFNALEGDQPEQLPHDVQFEGGGYRQLKDKTPNRHVATLTVYDRAGKRLGTVYLSVAPELGQHTLTARLTALIEAVLRRWEGPLPRLCYVTDAGDEETKYYYRVLWRMKHPRTGEKLLWTRIIDYYHASSRIWTMAEALFGKDTREGRAWALRMCRLLKKPGGVRRVLYSAAALRGRRSLTRAQLGMYEKAYRYLQKRTRQMRYHEYRGQNLPIGSGVTEAACKTVVTQRLKLSGMRWEKANAQKTLDLRVVWLSGIWGQTYRSLLTSS